MTESTDRGNKWVMEEYLPKEALVKYKAMFSMFDEDSTGLIKIEDVVKIFHMVGQSASLSTIQNLLNDIVGSNSRRGSSEFVDFKEFIAIISVSLTNCIPEDEMQLVFRQFDLNGDGYISAQDLKDVLGSLGDEITDKDLEEMMREADQDGDGKVSYHEFIRVMTSSVQTSSAGSCEEDNDIKSPSLADNDRNSINEQRSESDLSLDKHSVSDSSIKFSKTKDAKRRMSTGMISWISNVTVRKKRMSSMKSSSPGTPSGVNIPPFKNRLNKQSSSKNRFSTMFFWRSAFTRKRK